MIRLLFIGLCCGVLLAACNSSSDSSSSAIPDTNGGINPPTAIASDLAPPADGELPADLMPPS